MRRARQVLRCSLCDGPNWCVKLRWCAGTVRLAGRATLRVMGDQVDAGELLQSAFVRGDGFLCRIDREYWDCFVISSAVPFTYVRLGCTRWTAVMSVA